MSAMLPRMMLTRSLRPMMRTMLGRSMSSGVNVMSSGVNTASSGVVASDTNLLISDSAVTRLKEISGEGGWLRVSVEGGGCSGFQYKLDLEEGGVEMGEEDVLVEREGARVVVDQTSLEYLQVSTVTHLRYQMASN